MSNQSFLSVTELNRYIAYQFDKNEALQTVYLEGEISNCKLSGKHYYFSLKDSTSEISAMFFYPANLSLNFKLRDGLSVQVMGKVGVYQKRGTYSIVISKMAECGVGLLYQNYLELKAKLEEEGLFKEEHKLPIPDYPECVGIITAPTGEAINDIVSTFNRRFPLAKLKLFPSLVQGADAPKSLINALDLAYLDEELEVIIIGRGGGSFEDLNCFNDELLARKLYSSKIPTVSAVGHEGDYTICDFVCSFRAPTPTGAAMRLTKEKNDVALKIVDYSKRLVMGMKSSLINAYNQYSQLANSYYLAHFDDYLSKQTDALSSLHAKLSAYSPSNIVSKFDFEINNMNSRLALSIDNLLISKEQLLNSLSNRLRMELVLDQISIKEKELLRLSKDLDNGINNNISRLENAYLPLLDKTIILNPLNILKKGYTVVYKNNQIVEKSTDLLINDKIQVKFYDNVIEAVVTKNNNQGE